MTEVSVETFFINSKVSSLSLNNRLSEHVLQTQKFLNNKEKT